MARFTGGGSLDGAERPIASWVTSVATPERRGRSWYVRTGLDMFEFVGVDARGQAVTRLIKAFRDAMAAERKAVKDALQPKGCSCGHVFGTTGAWLSHLSGGVCVDPRICALTEIDGVFFVPGSDAEIAARR